jgi:hypothetical protein
VAARAASAKGRAPSSTLGDVRSPSSFTNGVVALRSMRNGDRAVRLHSLRGQALYVAPIRIGLGALWLVAAHLAGVTAASTLLACGGGVFMIAFVAFNDPRMGFARDVEAAPVPTGAVYATPLEQALAATVPSTVGLTVLAAVAVIWEPMLTALLGAISAGLGIAGLLRAFRVDPTLWWDRAGGVYRRDHNV